MACGQSVTWFWSMLLNKSRIVVVCSDPESSVSSQKYPQKINLYEKWLLVDIIQSRLCDALLKKMEKAASSGKHKGSRWNSCIECYRTLAYSWKSWNITMFLGRLLNKKKKTKYDAFLVRNPWMYFPVKPLQAIHLWAFWTYGFHLRH